MAYLCNSALTLREQINRRWPNRTKRRDGWMGSKNDHGPSDSGCVFAIDIDDQLLGSDLEDEGREQAEKLANELVELARRGKDAGRIKYIAYNKRIASGTKDSQFWVWRPIRRGFEKHIHVSFYEDCDKVDKPFFLKIFSEQPTQKNKIEASAPKFPGGDKLVYGKRNSAIRTMQEQLVKRGFEIEEKEMGKYGNSTSSAVSMFYKSIGINSGTIVKDGKKFGFKAWERLFGD